jgi:hypothetical protein
MRHGRRLTKLKTTGQKCQPEDRPAFVGRPVMRHTQSGMKKEPAQERERQKERKYMVDFYYRMYKSQILFRSADYINSFFDFITIIS